MIITNNMARVHYYGKIRILPGSNVIEDGAVDVNHPIIKAMIEAGDLSVDEKITEAVAERAIENAMDQKVVEEIVKGAPKAAKNIKAKADKKKAELDKFDERVKAEIEAARKKKEEDDE